MALDQAIAQLINDDPVLKPRVERLVAIKGLALLSVAVLMAETNGFEGFTNQRHLVSYAGYDVVENQSGNHTIFSGGLLTPYRRHNINDRPEHRSKNKDTIDIGTILPYYFDKV